MNGLLCSLSRTFCLTSGSSQRYCSSSYTAIQMRWTSLKMRVSVRQDSLSVSARISSCLRTESNVWLFGGHVEAVDGGHTLSGDGGKVKDGFSQTNCVPHARDGRVGEVTAKPAPQTTALPFKGEVCRSSHGLQEADVL